MIYGSTAIKHWYSDFRVPNDLDIIEKNPRKNTKNNEYYWTDAFQYIYDNNKNSKYVDPNFLYTIKVSHAAWNVKWEKTMKDIEFLQSKGCTLDKTLYNLLIEDWKKIHGDKKVKMNVNNSEFFKENIYRKYDHEWLHEQFAFYERPLNEKIRKDLNSPLCSKELWAELTDENKYKTALEELFVLTAERYVFIKTPQKNIKMKYLLIKMLKNMITSTTSGWFNLYLIENFTKLRMFSPENKLHWHKSLTKIKQN